MSQTSVVEQVAGQAGMKGDSRDDLVISAIAEGDVGFGKLVSRGTDPEVQGILPATGTDVTEPKNVLGVALQSHAMESNLSGDPRYLDEQAVSVLRRGAVFVKVEEAVTVADDVFVRVAAGGDGLGSFRASDPGASAAVQLAGAKWIKGAGIGEFALLEVNFEG